MLHRNVRPGREPASLAGRASKQKGHKHPALRPQLTHAHEASFTGSISNKRAILDIHLTEPYPKQQSFAGRGTWKHGSRPPDIVKTITDGVPGTPMLPFKGRLSPEEIAALASLVRSYDKTLKPGAGGRSK